MIKFEGKGEHRHEKEKECTSQFKVKRVTPKNWAGNTIHRERGHKELKRKRKYTSQFKQEQLLKLPYEYDYFIYIDEKKESNEFFYMVAVIVGKQILDSFIDALRDEQTKRNITELHFTEIE